MLHSAEKQFPKIIQEDGVILSKTQQYKDARKTKVAAAEKAVYEYIQRILPHVEKCVQVSIGRSLKSLKNVLRLPIFQLLLCLTISRAIHSIRSIPCLTRLDSMQCMNRLVVLFDFFTYSLELGLIVIAGKVWNEMMHSLQVDFLSHN